MADSLSVKQIKPIILDTLPDIPVAGKGCSARASQEIDLILLAIEALEQGGAEYILATAKQLELQDIIKNRVVLWRLRCTNPWRRSYNRKVLTIDRAKALTLVAGYRAKQLTVSIRQLLLAVQQMQEKELPLENHFRLSDYLERFRSHFRSRMNPRRVKVAIYLDSESALNELAVLMLDKLLFCTGTTGIQRFWVSLFDGEVR